MNESLSNIRVNDLLNVSSFYSIYNGMDSVKFKKGDRFLIEGVTGTGTIVVAENEVYTVQWDHWRDLCTYESKDCDPLWLKIGESDTYRDVDGHICKLEDYQGFREVYKFCECGRKVFDV